MKKKRCSVCGFRFVPTKEATYAANEPQTVSEALKKSATVYTMMDCPKCGCQQALSIRFPRIPTPVSAAEAFKGVTAAFKGLNSALHVSDEETTKERGEG